MRTSMQCSIDKEVVGIVQSNSIDYLDLVFQLLANKNQFVPLKNKVFSNKIKYLGFSYIAIPDVKTGWYSPKYELCNDNEVAQISFTSGTEGEPKGVILTHKQLNDTVTRLVDVMEITSEIKEYVGVPVYHSFGYGRIRVCNHVGGKAFIPSAGFNPREIATMLSNNEINSISAVPTQWRILLQQHNLFAEIGQHLRWIEIGSQFMSEKEKKDLHSVFPNALIVQHYGLTEASRTSFLTISDNKCLSTVGMPSHDCELRINNLGLIEIKGTHVADYQITSQGQQKITDASGWFTTSDLGSISQGYLTFLGRADDIINIGGLKVSPDEVERELNTLMAVTSGIAITKIKDSIRGETLLLSLSPALFLDLDIVQKHLNSILTNMDLNLGSQVAYQLVSKFPVTDTGKLQRKKLSEQYTNQQVDIDTIDPNAKFSEKVKLHLKLDIIGDHDSFLSLNGDSLLLVILSIEVEQHIGYLPENWEALTFAKLDALRNKVQVVPKVSFGASIWVIALIICGLVAGELFLQTRSFYKTGRSAFNLINNESTVVHNQALGINTYRPNIEVKDFQTGEIKYDINELGLRSPDIDVSPSKDELRIAIVGASSVAGVYAQNNESTFPALLEKQLRINNKATTNVINGGIQGANLGAIMTITEKIIGPLKPRYIMVYTGLNDLAQVCRTKTKNSAPKTQSLFEMPSIPSWLMTADMLKKNTVFLRNGPTNKNAFLDVNTMETDWFKNDIEKLITTIKSSGASPVLITNARSYINVDEEDVAKLAEGSLYFYTCLDLQGVISAGKIFNDIIRDASYRNNVPLIDLALIMPGGNKYFVDGGHFTLAGEKFVADKLAEFFEAKK